MRQGSRIFLVRAGANEEADRLLFRVGTDVFVTNFSSVITHNIFRRCYTLFLQTARRLEPTSTI